MSAVFRLRSRFDLHLIRLEAGLHPEGAPGSPLAVEAVADGDRERLSGHLEAQLAAVAGGVSGGHRRGS